MANNNTEIQRKMNRVNSEESVVSLSNIAILANAIFGARPPDSEHGLLSMWITMRDSARVFVENANTFVDSDAFEDRASRGYSIEGD